MDDQGRVRLDALAQLPPGEPLIVCLQAGNLHSGAFNPFTPPIALVHDRGGWVHVDGAFGLWGGRLSALPGCQGRDGRDRDVLSISVINWSTDEDDVRRSVEAVQRPARS